MVDNNTVQQVLTSLIEMMQKPDYSLTVDYVYKGVPVKVQVLLLQLGGLRKGDEWT